MVVKLVIGPMWAGKSSLIHEIRTDECDVISHTLDTRYAHDGIHTHDGKSSPCIRLSSLSEYKGRRDVKRIIVDETQFFPDVGKFILDHIHLDLVFVGLSSDSDGKMFASISEVLTFADEVRVLSGTCSRCTCPTRFTAAGGCLREFVPGGSELYTPLCTPCFHS